MIQIYKGGIKLKFSPMQFDTIDKEGGKIKLSINWKSHKGELSGPYVFSTKLTGLEIFLNIPPLYL